uniref:Guanylate cyclase domain-containing protein n=2 Tax=Guillardia theta TaxID=55529 RepID=A0A7S4PJ49_GUITH
MLPRSHSLAELHRPGEKHWLHGRGFEERKMTMKDIQQPSLLSLANNIPENVCDNCNFQEANYQPRIIFMASVFTALGGIMLFVLKFLIKENIGGGFAWQFLQELPFLLIAFYSGTYALIFSQARLRLFCIRNYSFLVVAFLFVVYLGFLLSDFMTELRRSEFEVSFHLNISWVIDFSHFPPDRNCTDQSPVTTMLLWPHFTSIGCVNLLLGGDKFCLYILFILQPLIYTIPGRPALLLCVMNVTVFIIAVVLLGSVSWSLLTCTLFQLIAGLSTAYLCQRDLRDSQHQFIITKKTKYASSQSKMLLYTLIPENVMSKLTFHDDSGLLGVKIPHCTILFCSFVQQDRIKAKGAVQTFQILDGIFEVFDNIVEKYGMYKYQHVGDWYIVTCPRAARPFDEKFQQEEYPHHYTQGMVHMARELIEATRSFRIDQYALGLKVGVSCGSAAGAVIGSHRAFYCVYGDTVNTAARMCKYAKEGQILCTREFADSIYSLACDYITCESSGELEVKGKGLMSVFNVVWDPHVVMDDQISGAESQRMEDTRSTASLTTAGLEFEYENLSPEGKQLLKSNTYRLSNFWVEFVHPKSESQFFEDTTEKFTFIVSIGLSVHFFAVLCQWQAVNFPDYEYDFAALGNQDLEYQKLRARWVLTGHLIFVFIHSVILQYLLFTSRLAYRNLQRNVVIQKMFFVVVSGLVNLRYHVGDWLILFPAVFSIIHSSVCGLTFRKNLLSSSICACFSMVMVFFAPHKVYRFRAILQIFFVAVISIVFSRIKNLAERKRWRLDKLFEVEFKRLKEVMIDLIPRHVAMEMLQFSGKIPCAMQRAAVLQLDICNFTGMSQTMDALELANMVHDLFSHFDDAVRRWGLFKMDTVGDAYIVAGWLPNRTDWLMRKETQVTCQHLLQLARVMLTTMADYRRRTGRTVNCRIGISTGVVATGVLGRIQSRFHMIGDALTESELLEQSCWHGAVHVSDKFLQCMRCMNPEVSPEMPMLAVRPSKRQSNCSRSSSICAVMGTDSFPSRRQSVHVIARKWKTMSRLEGIEGKPSLPQPWRCVAVNEHETKAKKHDTVQACEFNMKLSYILVFDEGREKDVS